MLILNDLRMRAAMAVKTAHGQCLTYRQNLAQAHCEPLELASLDLALADLSMAADAIARALQASVGNPMPDAEPWPYPPPPSQ